MGRRPRAVLAADAAASHVSDAQAATCEKSTARACMVEDRRSQPLHPGACTERARRPTDEQPGHQPVVLPQQRRGHVVHLHVTQYDRHGFGFVTHVRLVPLVRATFPWRPCKARLGRGCPSRGALALNAGRLLGLGLRAVGRRTRTPNRTAHVTTHYSLCAGRHAPHLWCDVIVAGPYLHDHTGPKAQGHRRPRTCRHSSRVGAMMMANVPSARVTRGWWACRPGARRDTCVT
jgi:hypothetical protein